MGLKSIYNARYTLHVIYFLVNITSHYSKSHLFNYPYYTTQDPTIFNTIISILQYCYHIVTYCNSIIYSYIYRYNISIKRYNNQYRYKNIYSIIRMIINNTKVNIYTVYTYHNYAIINTIIIYSNFLLA